MSGVEIIGLILGGLPVAISALEHYRDVLDPVKDYVRYDDTLKSLRIQLRMQQALFDGTMRRLLQDQLSDDQMKALFEPEPGVPAGKMLWGTDEIQEKVQRRLGTTYKTFMDVVVEMGKLMQRLMDKLDVDIDKKPKWDANVSMSSMQTLRRGGWELRKFRRSFGRKGRETLIKAFESHNKNIARYVEQREILPPTPKPRPDEFLKYYPTIRNHASVLYDALDAGWQCRCICAHSANLLLERRDDVNTAPGFKLFLSFLHSHSQDHPGQKAWLDAQVDIGEWDEDTETDDQHAQDVTTIATPSTPIPPRTTNPLTTNVSLPFTLGRRTGQSVRIVEPPVPLNLYSTSDARSRTKKTKRLPRISSLSEAMKVAHSDPTNLGSLADITQRRCVNITETKLAASDLAGPVALDSLLPSRSMSFQHRKSFCKLSRQQRLSIAVTLAHTVLQLHQSPWLSETWSKSDIFFYFQGADAFKRPIADLPYVSRSFASDRDEPQEIVKGAKTDDFVSRQIVNKSLFALGIVLIELCFNKPLEDKYAEAKDPELTSSEALPDTADIYGMATSLIDEVYSEQGTQYGYVVQRCLKCEFGIQSSGKQLDSDTFRALVYEGVLAPLEEDLRRYSILPGTGLCIWQASGKTADLFFRNVEPRKPSLKTHVISRVSQSPRP